MSDGSKPTKVDDYSPEAVERVFDFIGWLRRNHMANTLYYPMAAAMIPSYWLLTFVINNTKLHHMDRLPPKDTGFFLLCNHISMLDGQVVSMVTFPRTYWFPSKAAFYKNTAMGLAYTALTAFKSFPVRRGEKDLRAIDLIRDLLASGEGVLLFPEGTRSEGGLGKGKVGVGRLAHDAKPMIVPTYLEGFDEILGHGRWYPRVNQPAHINFGAPLDMGDLYAQEGTRETCQAIVDRVMAGIADLRDELHAELDS
jgi:1-acyl-sn-glycerol-3-phosphate acyltransferase